MDILTKRNLVEAKAVNFQDFHSLSKENQVSLVRIGADFWEGDATKHFSVKKRSFQ